MLLQSNNTDYQELQQKRKFFGHSKQQPWNKVSKSKIVDKVQVYIQDGKAYKPQKGIKVYIGKIYSK